MQPSDVTADGRLVVTGRDRNLYELDPVTSAATLIGPTGIEVVSRMSLLVLPRGSGGRN